MCFKTLKTSMPYSFCFEWWRISSEFNPIALKQQLSTSKCQYPHQRDTFLVEVGCQPTAMHDAYIHIPLEATATCSDPISNVFLGSLFMLTSKELLGIQCQLCRTNWTLGYCLYAVLYCNFLLVSSIIMIFINLFTCSLPGSSFYFHFLPPALYMYLIKRNNFSNVFLNKTTVHTVVEGVKAVDWHG